VRASGGRILTVGEDAIADARSELGRLGFDVEPTGAVAWAALAGGRPADGPVVVVLTGA
jgi:threonine synthase